MKFKSLFYTAAIMAAVFLTGCGTTSGIEGGSQDEKIEIPEAGNFEVFGMIELTIENYTPVVVNKTHTNNLKLRICNNSNKKTFLINTDENGFFRIENLDKYTSYTIQHVIVKPDPSYPDSEWTFGVWKNFTGTYADLQNAGAISVYSNKKTGEYAVKTDDAKSAAYYENLFNVKYELEVFKGPESYEKSLRYKKDSPDDTIYQYTNDPAKIKLRKSNPDKYIQEVCQIILKNANDDFDKVVLIHDAVTEMLAYDTKSYFSGRIPDQGYKAVMKSGLSVCAGYATVFQEFCNQLRIPCEIVEGFAKGYGFDPASRDITVNHDWNAVKVEGSWYLIDCTWDSGSVNGIDFERSYSSGHLFAKPEEFIFSHYPQNSKFQFMEKPLKDKDILFLPKIGMWQFAGSNNSPKLSVETIDTENRRIVLIAKYNPGVNAKYILKKNNNSVGKEIFSQEKIDDESSRLTFNLTEPGEYSMNLTYTGWVWDNYMRLIVAQ